MTEVGENLFSSSRGLHGRESGRTEGGSSTAAVLWLLFAVFFFYWFVSDSYRPIRFGKTPATTGQRWRELQLHNPHICQPLERKQRCVIDESTVN